MIKSAYDLYYTYSSNDYYVHKNMISQILIMNFRKKKTKNCHLTSLAIFLNLKIK